MIKKFTFIFSILLTVYCLLPTLSFTQITFQQTYGGTGEDYGYSIKPTLDGGYIIGGFTNRLSHFFSGDRKIPRALHPTYVIVDEHDEAAVVTFDSRNLKGKGL